jgi:hypothetical protein
MFLQLQGLALVALSSCCKIVEIHLVLDVLPKDIDEEVQVGPFLELHAYSD